MLSKYVTRNSNCEPIVHELAVEFNQLKLLGEVSTSKQAYSTTSKVVAAYESGTRQDILPYNSTLILS